MKRELSNVPAQRPFARHRLGMLGLALTLAPFAMVGEAQAICTEDGVASVTGSASGKTVVCSGTVTDTGPGGIAGYGTFVDTNNTYTVSGALTGNSFGLATGGGTLTNSGTITGTNIAGISNALSSLNNTLGATVQGFFGIVSNASDITISNAGLIKGTGGANGAIKAQNLHLT